MNYLHLFQPGPIVHRDLKSPNVLVDAHNSKVKSKEEDKGRRRRVGVSTYMKSFTLTAQLDEHWNVKISDFGLTTFKVYLKDFALLGTTHAYFQR